MYIVEKRLVENPLGTVILLPGRDGSPHRMMAQYEQHSELKLSNLVAVKPKDEWYPMPRGINNQTDAMKGLAEMIPWFSIYMLELEDALGVPRSDMALVGFSAGAVVAIQLASYSEQPFRAVVSHCGAILNTNEMEKARHLTPHLLIHAQDDDCFEWAERYLPMKECLLRNGYVLHSVEKEKGGHRMTTNDIAVSAVFLSTLFKYPANWQHSAESDWAAE